MQSLAEGSILLIAGREMNKIAASQIEAAKEVAE